MSKSKVNQVDLFIIGGGINGCGIARDAVGRGLSVTLANVKNYLTIVKLLFTINQNHQSSY